MSRPSNNHAEPAEKSVAHDTIADRLVANKARAVELLQSHRERLRKLQQAAGSLTRTKSSSELQELREELEQKQQTWLDIQDRVCQQQEAFLLEVQNNDRQQSDFNIETEELRQEVASWKAKYEELQSQQQDRGEISEHEDMLKHAEALAEIHDLRAANAQLRSQLEAFEKNQSKIAAAGNQGGFDWEEHKRKMLSELEGGEPAPVEPQGIPVWSEAPTPTPSSESTDASHELLVQREEEIERLKTTIQEQADCIAELEKALAESSDQDEVDRRVREERNKLSTMQDEWREMLRLAEVEISVERAKLARDQRKLEDQAGEYKTEIKRLEQSVENLKAGNTTSQGNWLTRLGLGGKK